MIEAGFCLYGCHRCRISGNQYSCDELEYLILPSNKTLWTKVMCGEYKRSGTLCGACQNGYYPPAYSFDTECISCRSGRLNWLKYLLSAFAPVTVFYFAILLFPINVISSSLAGFVFYSQIMASSITARDIIIYTHTNTHLLTIAKMLLAFYGVWNLDFFRTFTNICLQTDFLETLSLDLLIAFYPVILVLITSVIINSNIKLPIPFNRRIHTLFTLLQKKRKGQSSTIDVFTTFLLLSNVKLLSACFVLLIPVQVHQLTTPTNISYSTRLYYDATVHYFGTHHLPYAVIAIGALLVFEVLPILILVLFSFGYFQKCLNTFFSLRWQIFLRTYLDNFQGCFKDGTGHSGKDYRWLSSLPFVARLLFHLIYFTTPNSLFLPYSSMLMIILLIVIFATQLFKTQRLEESWIMNLLFLATFGTVGAGLSLEHQYRRDEPKFLYLAAAIAFLPILSLLISFVKYVFNHTQFGVQIRQIKDRSQGYFTT